MEFLELSEMLQATYSLTQTLLSNADLKPDFETFVSDQEELVLQLSFHMNGRPLLCYWT